MKELSIEEKAKRYDEAIRKAKITLGCCDSASIITEHTIYDIFPELAESKDEKIRKAIYGWTQAVATFSLFARIIKNYQELSRI